MVLQWAPDADSVFCNRLTSCKRCQHVDKMIWWHSYWKVQIEIFIISSLRRGLSPKVVRSSDQGAIVCKSRATHEYRGLLVRRPIGIFTGSISMLPFQWKENGNSDKDKSGGGGGGGGGEWREERKKERKKKLGLEGRGWGGGGGGGVPGVGGSRDYQRSHFNNLLFWQGKTESLIIFPGSPAARITPLAPRRSLDM